MVADEERKAAVKEAFVWSWDAYEKYAWGSDEVCPLILRSSKLVDTVASRVEL